MTRKAQNLAAATAQAVIVAQQIGEPVNICQHTSGECELTSTVAPFPGPVVATVQPTGEVDFAKPFPLLPPLNPSPSFRPY